jgi:sugar phosphate isomerase/epimerase
LKKKFPFRLGTTSYIIPADIISNVQGLAGSVDDIELVLFESDEISNLPDQYTVQTLCALTDKHDITYTVHLPLDIVPGAIDETLRKKSVEKCLRVIKRMQALDPFAYILHGTGNHSIMGTGSSETIHDWSPQLSKSIGEIINSGVDPGLLCLETLNYPFELVENIICKYNLSVCLDIGHILLYGYPMDEYLIKYLSRTRVIHLHGIIDGNDHQSISALDGALLSRLFLKLFKENKKERVVTLEIFNENDFSESLDILRGYVP